MGAVVSQIRGNCVGVSTCPGWQQGKDQSFALLALCEENLPWCAINRQMLSVHYRMWPITKGEGLKLLYWCLNTLRPRQNGRHFQTTISNAFSSMKIFEFRLRFYLSLLPRVQLTIFQHWFRKWLDGDQATSHYLNQWWLIYWRIYASLGLNE